MDRLEEKVAASLAAPQDFVSPPEMGEQRITRRKSVLLPGIACYAGGLRKFDCTIRDLTEKGAGISFAKHFHLADSLLLINVRDHLVYDTTVNWCGAAEAGLSFTQTRHLGQIPDPALHFLKRFWLERAIR
jgi:hypothetical protein